MNLHIFKNKQRKIKLSITNQKRNPNFNQIETKIEKNSSFKSNQIRVSLPRTTIEEDEIEFEPKLKD